MNWPRLWDISLYEIRIYLLRCLLGCCCWVVGFGLVGCFGFWVWLLGFGFWVFWFKGQSTLYMYMPQSNCRVWTSPLSYWPWLGGSSSPGGKCQIATGSIFAAATCWNAQWHSNVTCMNQRGWESLPWWGEGGGGGGGGRG